MKPYKNLQYLSLILSGVLLMGISLPAFGVLSSSKTDSIVETSKEILTARRRFSFSAFRNRPPSRNIWRPGARRGACLAKNQEITPLLPADTDTELKGTKTYHESAWNTVSDRPTVFFHIPETNDKFTGQAELVLKSKNEKNEKVIYFARLQLPNKSGIVGVTFPNNEKKAQWTGLADNEEYYWDLMIICKGDDTDAASTPHTGGLLQKVSVDPALAEQINTTAPLDRVGIYAESGIVYESISTLAELRQANDNDPEVKEQWQDLLITMGHEDMINVPLVGSATIIEEGPNYIFPEATP